MQQAEASVVSQKSLGGGAWGPGLGAQGLGPGPPGAWDPASKILGPKPSHRRSEKSPGGRQAKGGFHPLRY